MFVFDPLTQGLELLAKRDLQRAETLFLRVINDPYVQNEELDQARAYLKDIRSCEAGDQSLDFERYKKLSRKTTLSLDKIYDLLADLWRAGSRYRSIHGRTVSGRRSGSARYSSA